MCGEERAGCGAIDRERGHDNGSHAIRQTGAGAGAPRDAPDGADGRGGHRIAAAIVRRAAGATTVPDWHIGFPGSFCGGIVGIGCPAGYDCVFDPAVCDPTNGGADCGGRCEPATTNPCAAMLCEQGTDCCPNCGGICVPPGTTCSDALCAGEPCGRNVCPAGEVCCNESCGICTPPGGMCPMIACLPDDAMPF